MGLISRVSSRTYRRRKISIMPDQAINSNSRSASYAKKVLYKRKRWTTSGEKKAAEKTGQVGRAQRFYPVDQERRRFKTTGAGILPSHPEIEGRYRSRLRFDFGRRTTPRQESCLLEAIRKWFVVGYWTIQN